MEKDAITRHQLFRYFFDKGKIALKKSHDRRNNSVRSLYMVELAIDRSTVPKLERSRNAVATKR
jgi:hypothetical protein